MFYLQTTKIETNRLWRKVQNKLQTDHYAIENQSQTQSDVCVCAPLPKNPAAQLQLLLVHVFLSVSHSKVNLLVVFVALGNILNLVSVSVRKSFIFKNLFLFMCKISNKKKQKNTNGKLIKHDLLTLRQNDSHTHTPLTRVHHIDRGNLISCQFPLTLFIFRVGQKFHKIRLRGKSLDRYSSTKQIGVLVSIRNLLCAILPKYCESQLICHQNKM